MSKWQFLSVFRGMGDCKTRQIVESTVKWWLDQVCELPKEKPLGYQGFFFLNIRVLIFTQQLFLGYEERNILDAIMYSADFMSI